MKIFLVLFACVLLGVTALNRALIAEEVEKIGDFVDDCNRINSSFSNMERNHDRNHHRHPLSRDDDKCIMFCVLRKQHIMNSDGSINSHVDSDWLQRVRADDSDLYYTIQKIYHTCNDKIQDRSYNHCDTAYELIGCYRDQARKEHLMDQLLEY